MKRRKWFLSSLAVLLVLGAIAVGGAYWLAHRIPSYYHQRALTRQQQVDLSNAAFQKYLRAQEAVKGQHAQELRIQYADSHGHPTTATAALDPMTVEFSQDELNALLAQWNATYRNKLESWVTDPIIALADGQIILAGRIKDPAIVISIHLRPSIDADGKLQLDIASVQSGSLPLPESAFSKQRQTLISMLSGSLPMLQQGATIEADGAFNGSAVKAAMDELLLQSLQNKASLPYLFFPDPADRSVRTLPVKLTGVSVEGDKLTLQLAFVSPEERQALMQKIREPEEKRVDGPPMNTDTH